MLTKLNTFARYEFKVVVYRQCITFFLMAPVAYFSRRGTKECFLGRGWKSFWLIFMLSFVGVTINQNIYFEGLYLASSSAASALANFIPAITFVMAYTLGLEKVHLGSLRNMAKMIGTVFCVAGATAMALLKGPKLLNMEFLGPNEHDTWLLGCLFLLGSACCWSLWLILKGKKKFMEDAHKIFSSPNGGKAFFGVYDGHGGSKAAEFVTQNLHLKILEMLDNSSANKEKEEAVKDGYLKTDEEFLKQGMGSGVCCLTALIDGREMIVSNLGDCRAVLCRDGIAEAITTDHTPGREDERRRIEEKGGYVEFHRGSWRVHGTLAVSRSIGDAHLKDWVMAEPDTTVVRLTPDMEYLVLASDGLWQEVSNQEAIDVVTQSCLKKKQLMRPSPAKVVGPSVSPLSNSLRFPLLKSNWIFHPTTAHKTSSFQQKTSEDDEQCCENASPPSKSRRISLAKQMRIRTHSPNNENQVLGEKPTHDGLLDACKELVNLAVTRGSLDDITVMVVDLSRHIGREIES